MSDPKDDKNDLRTQLESTLADLKSMAGDLGEKLGKSAATAQTEAKERWKKLEPKVKEKLQAADKEINEVGDAAAEQLKGLYGELKTSLSSLREKLHAGDGSGADEPVDADKN